MSITSLFTVDDDRIMGVYVVYIVETSEEDRSGARRQEGLLTIGGVRYCSATRLLK